MIPSEHALSIINIQQGLFHSPASPYQADALLTGIRLLIKKAGQAEAPIFFAHRTGSGDSSFSVQSSLTQLLPEMGASGRRDIVFIKRYSSCFQHADLAYRFAQAGVKQLVIAGIRTGFCVDMTHHVVSVLGRWTMLTSDVHLTMGNERLPAPNIIGHRNITFARPFVSLSAVAEWYFSIEK